MAEVGPSTSTHKENLPINKKKDFNLPCHLTYGSLSDTKFNKEHMCIVVSLNSITTKNFGCAYNLFKKYPYADIVGMRYSDNIFNNIAHEESQSPPGSVEICPPPIYLPAPTIASIVSQFGIGLPFEENKYAQKIANGCNDVKLVRNLSEDTAENRIKHFNRCLINLADELKTNHTKYLSVVIFPVGIGRRGRVDNIWLKYYLPLIGEFATDMQTYGKDCILVCNASYLRVLEKKYCEQSDYESNFSFQKLCSLPLVSIDDYLFTTKIK